MEPWEREVIRRSTAMLTRGQQTPLRREEVLALLNELDRLERRERQAEELASKLRGLLNDFDR